MKNENISVKEPLAGASGSSFPTDSWGEVNLLADPIRRAIFFKLESGPMHVNALVADLPVSQSAVSQQLKKMKAAGIVQEQRRGKFIFYAANPDTLNKLVAQLDVLRSRLRLQVQPPVDRSRDGGKYVPITSDAIDISMDNWAAQWPQHDPLIVGILVRLHMISDQLKNNLTRSVAHFRLNSVETQLLATLELIGPPYESTLTELSKIAKRSLPVVSRYLDRAVNNQFILRIPSGQDGRSNILRLTDKGREILHQIMEYQRELDFAKIYQMPYEQRQLTAQVTRDLLAKLTS